MTSAPRIASDPEQEQHEQVSADALALQKRLRDLVPTVKRLSKLAGNVGVSFGVLRRGKVVLAEGLGYRNLTEKKAADEDTLYNIASLTKAFTATAVALLVEDGVLEMDVPVKRYIPELRDKEITLIDMMSHRTGYARLDPSWLGADSQMLVSHADLLERANGLPRAKPLRSVWLYNNWTYALAGEIIKRVGGVGSYEEFMEERILSRFGMKQPCIRKERIPDDNITIAYASKITGEAMILNEHP